MIESSNTKNYFDDVSLLITHYNRSISLERLLKKFNDLNIIFQQIVVSDDGSSQDHLNRVKGLQSKYQFQLITSPSNKGLGHNINKGQSVIYTPYTLYIQEDFIPQERFKSVLSDGLELMKERNDIDIIRFWSYFTYPYLKPYKNGFSEMLWKPWPWYTDHLKFYYYSDHPHMRRNTFTEKFGKFHEGMKGDTTEFSMCLSFLQNKGKGLFYDNFPLLFKHDNTQEPSTMKRENWKQKNDPFTTFLRWVYLKFKFIKNSIQLIK
ncbi:MAG TPA: glycosyltransferase [Daejeonella sp.]|uniref:glycosyltransferase family 2 protein n=1 Tax=Daejeonella sp. TaxID=2805397 RepID=UPI002EDA53D3